MYCLQHSKLGQSYVHPATRHEVTAGKYRYSSTLYLTSALDGGGAFNATPRPLYSREREPVPIVQEVGWAPEPVWTGAENNTEELLQCIRMRFVRISL